MKRANPEARVALPGLTYWWDKQYDRPQYFERFLQAAEQDPDAPAHNWFFDAAVLHLYNEPAGLYRVTQLFRELRAARGLSRPIWINETNVAPWDDPQNPMPRADFRATLDEQASYLIQAFAWALAAGVEHVSVYPWCDGNAPPGQELMGLVRGDGSTRPAYRAFQTATRYFSGVRDGSVEREGSVVTITLRRPGETIAVAWTMAPEPAVVAIPARGGQALLIDKYANEQPLAASDGVYRLDLEPATANTVNGDPGLYLIGGNPLLVVQSDDSPAPGC